MSRVQKQNGLKAVRFSKTSHTPSPFRMGAWLALGACAVIWSGMLWGGWACSGNQSQENPPPENSTPNDGGTGDTGPTADRSAPPTPHAKPTGCHPFSLGQGDCAMPFPSSYYLVKDDTTETKFRLAFPEGVLPVSEQGEDNPVPIKTEVFNQRDGFSPATPIMLLFPERINADTLVKSADIERSIKPDSPVQLIEFGSKKRIPLFAEVDRTVKPEEPQLLIIRPQVRLDPAKRYAVVLLKTIQSVDGKALTPPPAYVRLAAGEAPQTPAEAALAPLIKETLEEVKGAGLKAEEILVTWDFWTASDKPLLDQMISMRDQMLKAIGDKGPDYTITDTFNSTKEQNKELMRIVQGKFKVPTFMSKDEPGGELVLDANGMPKIRDTVEYTFQLHIPHCVAERDKPVPVMQFGHGLFGGAQGEMDSGYQRGLINRLCMVQIGHDWIGLSAQDRGYVAATILPDMNKVSHLTNRLQQAHVNAIALTRLIMHRLPQEKALEVNGKPSVDGKEIYYLGISNGAIQGGTFMALSPDITRGILNVGGGPWNMMMSRSSDFGTLFTVLKVFYKKPVERQLLIALTQFHFDVVDPLTYAAYVLKDPQRMGVPPKKIIIQESIDDTQVPNITTRVWARTMGVPALNTLFEPVFGLELKDGPLDGSAYTQFGPRHEPVPADENVPPKSNPAHEAARRNENCIKQMESFFLPDGKIVHYCQGACDPD